MSDFSQYEARINAALERIGSGLDTALEAARAPQGGISTEAMEEEMGRLRETLEAERAEKAQLVSRVKAIKDRQELHVTTLEKEVENLRKQLMSQDISAQRLKAVNDQLRANSAELRAACETGVVDAHLINKSMLGELDGLRASRDADSSEIEAILAELRPFVSDAAPTLPPQTLTAQTLTAQPLPDQTLPVQTPPEEDTDA
ncbi:hypothetical protein AQS8620_03076 [Aquimixticola soesokkakensis]|uniref:Uncharacterized protein n=1 Tax=Aquimixticola soesokkakensis TaxID=1519096 RepID=A0A1Y5TR03_9RHOB|nr:hypothetical protein [Aquimixticola soesokkakensis]SLN66206.1 hypothetical protein AQS8620_03076 [Aquimixticola soesokkakensis]